MELTFIRNSLELAHSDNQPIEPYLEIKCKKLISLTKLDNISVSAGRETCVYFQLILNHNYMVPSSD
jgi:hypothetical protein